MKAPAPQYRLLRRTNGLGISEYQLQRADGVLMVNGETNWRNVTDWVSHFAAVEALIEHYKSVNTSEPEEYQNHDELMTLIKHLTRTNIAGEGQA
jgi:hypothetical protein